MVEAATRILNKPAWVDLGTSDPAAAREFYAKVFGWNVEVNPDPQYGGYALAKVDGQDAAGIGGTMSPEQPTAWSVYIGTDDIEDMSMRVTEAGGAVSGIGRSTSATRAGWPCSRIPRERSSRPGRARGWAASQTEGANSFGWAELNARGADKAVPFYKQVFGWDPKAVGTPDQPYTEFQLGGQSIAGATEMNPMVPAEVPNYWQVYFTVDDVDASHATAVGAGARELLAPMDFPGGRMSILSDPQGASFGLMRMAETR